ncbi:STAS domain-containing protein [Siculibacillus lacustris]|uniref:STAS domain-containing protein n=1 Tax=Siculibacillus lacustris TaxID=1549641 RepID=A0A4Q9VPE6_9HYPH|nr:STAS domain-containing protein [Siculibacillus lacustris]TBW37616.1 STAS domain-containing protein [Siculibacillus lacustris]
MSESKERHRISLAGNLTIRNSAEIHATISEFLESNQTVDLDCTDATEVDFSFLQLLLAARKTASLTGRSLSITHTRHGVLHDAATRAGLVGTAAVASDADRAFWATLDKETDDAQDHPHRG